LLASGPARGAGAGGSRPRARLSASDPGGQRAEFISRTVDQGAFEHGVEVHFIEPGKPTQNAFIESLNGKFRDECLNENCVSNFAGGAGEDRSVAEGLQPGTTAQRSGVSDARGIRGTGSGARGVSPHAPRLHSPGVDFNPGTHIMIGPQNGGRALASQGTVQLPSPKGTVTRRRTQSSEPSHK